MSRPAPPESVSLCARAYHARTLQGGFRDEVDDERVIPTLVVESESAIEAEERLLLADILPPDENDGALRYDAEAIAAHYRQHPFQVWGRVFGIFFSVSLHLRCDGGGNSRLGFTERKHRQQAVRLREILTRMGPAFHQGWGKRCLHDLTWYRRNI